MKNIILFILILISVSCVTQKKCYQKFPPAESRDSVYIEKIKEIPVFIPGDTVNIAVPINCPDQDVFAIENGKLKQQVKILNGKLYASTNIKPDTIKIPVKETQTVIKEVKIPQPVKYVPALYKYCLWICIILIIYVGLRVYTKIK